MKLYTVCVAERPVLVMATDVEPRLPYPVPAEMVTALHDQRALLERLHATPGVQHLACMREIDEALDTWLGADLRDCGLWNGDRRAVQIREASEQEAASWRTSLQQAVATGEQDAGNEDWLAFLPPLRDPAATAPPASPAPD